MRPVEGAVAPVRVAVRVVRAWVDRFRIDTRTIIQAGFFHIDALPVNGRSLVIVVVMLDDLALRRRGRRVSVRVSVRAKICRRG
jgi:hypothetical protein